MASAVLADPTRALQGTNWESGLAMEESENDVGSLEQHLLYADEHYLAGKLPLGDHLGKLLLGMNHPCVCRAWRPVSLERRVLVIEGSQHIALASASGKREVHFGPMCINRLVGRLTACLGSSDRYVC
ncbi:15-hydroxyprostaglandin dehydrogenase [Trichonephila clavipes]|uniref:15-hydroxyprostaglandin dehydrogenase n=1 Tax=Trichonephila clavipes TaxID=2585209 RepID=A0A8X6V6J0_TRICX|nr:15-hydroxyprostaglandin dehydrogenase [Trichonephila clavipes]